MALVSLGSHCYSKRLKIQLKGNSSGTNNTVVININSVKGTPIRKKSLKRYWPGPKTRVFTGDDTGVIKAAEAAMATVMAKAAGATPKASAAAMAMGAKSTAVAVLEINKPVVAVAINKTTKITLGAEFPNTFIMPCTAKSIPPVFCNAAAKGIMPTIKIKLGQ